MGKTVHLAISNCIDCPHHYIERDPDPFDSDDVKVVCQKNEEKCNCGMSTIQC